MSTSTPKFVDAYYADSWVDADALKDSRLSPRRFNTAGPFRTFAEAHGYVPRWRPDATHYKVRKLIVNEEMIHFITLDIPPNRNTKQQSS